MTVAMSIEFWWVVFKALVIDSKVYLLLVGASLGLVTLSGLVADLVLTMLRNKVKK